MRSNNMYGMDYDICVKSILIGDSSVGKSSLLYRYTDHDWNPHYIATIGVDFKVVTFERAAKVVKLQLWDTAGQERFRTITHSYYRGAHGILLVFDVTNRESFDNLSDWLADVRQYGVEGSPMVLVGNKADCANREVKEEEAQLFAQKLGCQYFETSAKQNKSVDDAFNALVDLCVKSRAKLPTVTTTKRPLNLEEAQKLRTTKTSSGPCEC